MKYKSQVLGSRREQSEEEETKEIVREKVNEYYHPRPFSREKDAIKSSDSTGFKLASFIESGITLTIGLLSYYLLFYCQLSIPNALRQCFKHFPEFLQPSTNYITNALEATIPEYSSNTTDVVKPVHPVIDEAITSLHDFAAKHCAIQTFIGMIISASFFTLTYYIFSSIYYNRNHKKPRFTKAQKRGSEISEEFASESDSKSKNAQVFKESILFGSMIASSVHALLVVILGSILHTRLFVPASHVAVKDMFQNKLTGVSPLGSVHTTIAAGYFLWDLGISILRYKIFGFSVLLHSITGILTFTLLPFSGFGQYFISFCLLYEISTVPLNIMTYCRDFATRNSLSNFAGLIFGILFLYIRIFRGYEIQKEAQQTANDNYDIIFTENDAERILNSTTIKGDIAKRIFETKEEFHLKIKELLYWSYSGVNLSFWVLNVIWGYQVTFKILRGIRKIFFGPKNQTIPEEEKID